MKKYSRQREALIQSLLNNHTHPTADELYLDLKKQISNISLGTVYRNLSQLLDEGKLIKLSFKNSPDRFDGDITPHMHFICTCCENVFDFPYDDLLKDVYSNFLRDVSINNDKFLINETNISFYGLCQNCNDKS